MYKISKYNIILADGQELLLFNSMQGLDSVCRVTADNADDVRKILEEETLSELNDDIRNVLYQKGYIIHEKDDEECKLEEKYISMMTNRMLRLIILPTEQCNFRCKYCYEDFKRGEMSLKTQNSIVKFVQKNIQYFEGLRVSWFGGEPLLGMDVIRYLSNEFIRICKHTKRKYVSDMTTNGYLLSEKVLRELLQYKVCEYQITIDGLREVHNLKKPLTNGGETFDVVINNLTDIKKNIKTQMFKILIRNNVTRDAVEDMNELTKYFRDLFGNDGRFSFFFRAAGDWGGKNRINEIKRIEDYEICDVYNNLINSENDLCVDIYKTFYGLGGCVCYAAFQSMFVIDSEGGLRKCTCGLDNDDYRIGHMSEKGELVLDDEKHRRWIGNIVRFSDKCCGCKFLPMCFGATCPRSNMYERTDDNDIKCPTEWKYIQQTLKLLEKGNTFTKI